MIHLAAPDIEEEEIQAVVSVLKSGMLVQGPQVALFEQTMQSWLTPQHQAVAVSSGTAALHLSLLALGVGPGDAVILPAYSWPATANVIELTGARPVFTDIEARTFGMSAEGLESAIGKARSLPGTRLTAVMVVHAFGTLPDMDALLAICEARGLPLIEDAACAIGASWKTRPAGTLGLMGCFSFHPRKIVTTGEGGLVCTGDETLVRKLRALRNHGLDPDAPGPDFIAPGFNYRMTDFQGALGVAQLRKLADMLADRKTLADRYDALFAGSRVRPQGHPAACAPNRQAYVVALPPTTDRDTVIARLKDAGIASTIGTWHIPLIRCYRERYGYRPGDFPVADGVFAHALTLPLHRRMSPDDVDCVAGTLLRIVDALG